MRFHRLPLGVAAASLAVAASVGIALAQPNSAASTDAAVVSQASADQLAAFSILATPRTSEDDISVGSLSAIAERLGTVARANIQLARRIGPSGAADITWLVPGEGQLCVVTDDGDRVSFQCVATEIAATGNALQTRSGGPELKDRTAIVAQLLPDGVRSVTVSSTDEDIKTEVAVSRNWVLKKFESPSAITFSLAGASHTIPIGHLPS